MLFTLLAVFAYPSMSEHRRKGMRAEGKAALLRTAHLQERRYVDSSSRAYVQDVALLYGKPAGTAIYSGEEPADARGAYRIVVEPETAACPLNRCFLLTAVPTFTDLDCGNFALRSTGERLWEKKREDRWWARKEECKWVAVLE